MLGLVLLALAIGLPLLAIACRLGGWLLGAAIVVLTAPFVFLAVFFRSTRKARRPRPERGA